MRGLGTEVGRGRGKGKGRGEGREGGASDELRCAHCGLSALERPTDEPELPRTEDDRWYCCAGCQTVAEALRAGGLEQWYDVAGADRAPARTTGRKYEELDDPTFTARRVTTSEDGLAHTQLYLEDLRCTACVWLVERLPTIEPGVVEARVDLGRGLAEVAFDPRRAPLSRIAAALDRLGHPVHPYLQVDRDAQRRREDRSLLLRIGLAGAAAGNVMLLAAALYAGWLGGAMTATETTFLRWTSMIVALPMLGYAAIPFFRTALASLRSRRLHLDLPIALGIAAGLVGGAVNVLRGRGEIYFDSVGMLVFLLLIARFIQARHQRKASVAAEMLLALTPRRARLLDDAGRASEVPVEAVQLGQRFEVLPGETVPLDGVLEEGSTTIDRSLLTGESRPAQANVGDELFAGTLNLSAAVRLRATAAGEATRVGQLVARVAELARRRAPVERLVDRVAGKFVAVVTSAAALTIGGWALAGQLGAGVEHAMALLVVTCPCALALATPLAVSVALSRAARRGLLIKGADALEALAHPGVIVLDKTGTVTLGAHRVVSWAGDPSAAALASALERQSRHPVAQALRSHAAPADVTFEDVRETLGGGVLGTLARPGGAPTQLAVGSPRWIAAHAALPAELEPALAAARARGESVALVAVDKTVVAVAGLADPLRDDARAAVQQLRALGWDVELLSGDDELAVRRAGQALGLDEARCRGGVLPEDKAARIEELRARTRHGAVVMVGDGVNDAAALAAATCGVATHGSAEASIEAADVYASQPGVAHLVTLVEGARATLRTIHRNLRLSLLYNLSVGVLAVTGVLHPLLAAVLMPLSSLTVLLSSVRSRAMLPPATKVRTAPAARARRDADPGAADPSHRPLVAAASAAARESLAAAAPEGLP
ncbi:MAG: heavy metal translocating P-type ATPase metal-binding domain-containing protein [Kofleriaceae bacterium]